MFSPKFSSAGKGPSLNGKAKNMHQRYTLLAGGGGGGFALKKAFIFKHPVNQLTENYLKRLKTKNFMNVGCLYC